MERHLWGRAGFTTISENFVLPVEQTAEWFPDIVKLALKRNLWQSFPGLHEPLDVFRPVNSSTRGRCVARAASCLKSLPTEQLLRS